MIIVAGLFYLVIISIRVLILGSVPIFRSEQDMTIYIPVRKLDTYTFIKMFLPWFLNKLKKNVNNTLCDAGTASNCVGSCLLSRQLPTEFDTVPASNRTVRVSTPQAKKVFWNTLRLFFGFRKCFRTEGPKGAAA